MTQTGVLINLSAKGVQNIYLDLSPQYTFFKRSFRRHTNYAVQAVMVQAANQIGFSRTISFPIPRNGDLLAETYFCAYLPCCGVDTTANMYAKANRGVVTNKGLFGPAHNVMDSRFTNPTFSKWHAHTTSSGVSTTADPNKALLADGTFNGAKNVSETTANVNPGGSAGAFGAQAASVQRVKGKSVASGGGVVGIPSRVKDGGVTSGFGASTATVNDTEKAQQFLTGDDHANVGYVNALGHAMIQEAEFSVGGNSINKFSGEYMHIWHLMHNKSNDHSHDDNLFMYGDGVGAPMAETGSSAPHAIVESQNPLLNELGSYKLARFELRMPKVDGGSAQPNEPAYKKESYRLLSQSGNQFPKKTGAGLQTTAQYEPGELKAIDKANSAGMDGPTLRHNQLLSLNFLRKADLSHGQTPHYLTAAERARASINTTYRVKIYKSNGTEELPEATAKCYLIGQAGTHHPIQHVKPLADGAAAIKDKLAPPQHPTDQLSETSTAAWKKNQVAQLLPWSKDVLQDSVTVGVSATGVHTDTFLSKEAANGDLADGLASHSVAQTSAFSTAPEGCYAVSDQTYIEGVTEQREIIFGLGQDLLKYEQAGNFDLKSVTNEDLDPIFMQKYDNSSKKMIDYVIGDHSSYLGTDNAMFSLTFGTYVKKGGKLVLDGAFFGTHKEHMISCIKDPLDQLKTITTSSSGFQRQGRLLARRGLANKNNVQAFHVLANTLNERFGKWFTTTVTFSSHNEVDIGDAIVKNTDKHDNRLNYMPRQYDVGSNAVGKNGLAAELGIERHVMGQTTLTGGMELRTRVVTQANAAAAVDTPDTNRFTKYARLVFTGTELLRKTYGRLHITVGPVTMGEDAASGKGATYANWLNSYDPISAAKVRIGPQKDSGAPFVRFERINTDTHGTSFATAGAHTTIMPLFPGTTDIATNHPKVDIAGLIVPGRYQLGHRQNGILGGLTALGAETYVTTNIEFNTGKTKYLEPRSCGLIVGPSVGRPDYIPDKPSPDAIAFVVYNRVGPNERIIDTPVSASSAVEKGAKIKFEKVSTHSGTVGFSTTSGNMWVTTPNHATPVPHSLLMPKNSKITGCDAVDGLPGAVHFDETTLKTTGFIKDKYRNTIGKITAMTDANAAATAIKAIPLLGPSIKGTNAVHLDPLSFYESATSSSAQPLSSSKGFAGADGKYGTAGTEFDSAHSVYNTDSTEAGGSHQYISFVGLCPDLQGGTATRRASDNQTGMAASAGITASSLGRVQNKTISTAANVQNTAHAVTGYGTGWETVASRSTDARKGTMTALTAQGQEAVRGWDKRNDISTKTDNSSWKAVKHTGRRYWPTDYQKVASSEGAVAHKLRNDFVTTASHASGTVALSVGSKKAIRDGFAKRCHMSTVGNADHPEGTGRCVKVMVPLPFWYSRSGNKVCEAGRTQVLPIIALQYHDCKINIKLRSASDIVQTDHEARNIGLRCTGMQGLNGSLISGGAGAQTLDPVAKTELAAMVNDSVLTTAATNGGFAFTDKPTDKRLTYQGNSVAYGTEIAAWGGPGKAGAPLKTEAGSGILQAWQTGQSLQTDMGARSRAVPAKSGTAHPLTAAGERGGLIDAYLLAQTIFLDSNERRLFASHTHEYLITQVQSQEFSVAAQTRPEFQMLTLSCKLNFNHPVSQMYWVCQRPESAATRNWFRYEATHMGGDDLLIKSALTLNSHDREDQDQSDAMFSRVIQPQTYFNTAPAGGAGGTIRDPSEGGGKNIYMYSFAAHPKEWWPSGNLNMSRIDTATLKLYMKGHASQAHFGHQYTYAGGGYHKLADEIEFAAAAAGLTPAQKDACYYGTLTKGIDVRVYVQSYNIARIMSGMMALKYAN